MGKALAEKVKISIHALLAESDFNLHVMNPTIITISIHALLAESDYEIRNALAGASISIHALLAESDGKLYGRI